MDGVLEQSKSAERAYSASVVSRDVAEILAAGCLVGNDSDADDFGALFVEPVIAREGGMWPMVVQP
jgi:hypothetical protein